MKCGLKERIAVYLFEPTGVQKYASGSTLQYICANLVHFGENESASSTLFFFYNLYVKTILILNLHALLSTGTLSREMLTLVIQPNLIGVLLLAAQSLN